MNELPDREISLLVSVHVEQSEGRVTLRDARRAARQAIRNALWDREEMGFDHDQDKRLTVSLAGIELLPEQARILRKSRCKNAR